MSNGTKTEGIGFCGLLTIVFIILKLTNVIDWSWVWVLSPIWISFIFGIGVIAGIILIGWFIMTFFEDKENK